MILLGFLLLLLVSSVVLVLVDAVLNARGATWRPALVVKHIANAAYDGVFNFSRALTILADFWNGFRRIVTAIRDWILPFIPLGKLKESLSDFSDGFWTFARVPLAPLRATKQGIQESESPWLTGFVYVVGWLFIPGTWEATVRHMTWRPWLGPVWWLRALYDALYSLGHLFAKLADLKEFFYDLAAQILVYVPLEVIKDAFKELYGWAGRVVYESWFLGVKDGLAELGINNTYITVAGTCIGLIVSIIMIVYMDKLVYWLTCSHPSDEDDSSSSSNDDDPPAPDASGRGRGRRKLVVGSSA